MNRDTEPTPDPRQDKADFVLTASTVLHAALARRLAVLEARAQAAPLQGTPVAAGAEVFAFRLLAAASRQTAALPDHPLRDNRQQLTLTIRQGDGRLELSLQALGFAALRRIAGKQARLVSADQRIDRRFGFDRNGSGRVILQDSPEIRTALAALSVILDGGGAP